MAEEFDAPTKDGIFVKSNPKILVKYSNYTSLVMIVTKCIREFVIEKAS